MKLRIVLASSPLNSPFFEDGIEVALTAADLEVETEVVLTGAFLEYVKNTSLLVSTAFISAFSNVGAIDMTSPVAFICGPRLRFAYTNLSNGQRGSLTTT